MTLLAPWGLVAGGLLGPLVLWYLLRSRRPRRVISSTLLFAEEHETASAAVPWQPFRADRTFWLVALAVLLGALALARPAIAVPAQVSDHTILVIDASASMQAVTDDGRSRLELARQTARDLAQRAGSGRWVSVVEAAAQARVLADAQPSDVAIGALDRLQAADTAPAMDQAMTLAGALIRPGEDTVIHLITDGGVDPAAMSLAPGGTVVDVVGASQQNIAVAAVQATPLGGGDARVLVELASFADLAVTARVAFVVDDTEVKTLSAELPPRGRVDVQTEIIGVEAPMVQIVATVEGTGPDGRPIVDAQPHDNRGWVVLPEQAGVQVMVAGPPNTFLDAVLAALPDVTITRRATVPARLDGVDVLVTDRVALPQVTVPTVAIAPSALPDGLTVTGTREGPTITRIDTDDPLLADVDLQRLGVARMDVVDAPGLRAVVEGPGGPLLLTGRIGPLPTVIMPFELSNSNLPLEVAFPVMMANAVQVLAGPSSDTPLVAGADRSLPLGQGSRAKLTSPTGTVVQVDSQRPTATLDQTGMWHIQQSDDAAGSATSLLAVNPDIGESDLVVTQPQLPADVVQPGTTDNAVGRTATEQAALPQTLAAQGRIELSRWLILSALLLLGIEVAAWAWQHRSEGAVPA